MNTRLWSLPKDERLRLLRALIHPINWRPCTARPRRLKPGEPFPAAWRRDLRRLCKLYGCRLRVQLVRADDERFAITGVYSSRKRTVHLVGERGGIISSYSLCTTWCHELAHRIQHIFYRDVNDKARDARVAYEHEAGRLGYFVYRAYLAHLMDLHPNSFRVYQSKSAQRWLMDR
jgi:hypothetical protein